MNTGQRVGTVFSNWLPLGTALLIFLALARWAGMPQQNQGLFWVGVGSLLLILAAGGLLAWHLLWRKAAFPEEDMLPATRWPSAGGYRTLAVLLAAAGIAVVVGAFWDEVWHRQYGVPFGKDLFWRPHLLMYAGLLTVTLVTVVALGRLWRERTGSWRQRLRARPAVAWLLLLGAFMAYAVPLDPAWHMLYGEDISAWSVPHLLLMSSFSAIMLVAVLQHLASQAPRHEAERLPVGRPLARALSADLLVPVSLAFALLLTLQLLTTEWDSLQLIQRGSTQVFWQRPEWLLPALITAVAAFFGTLANRVLRGVGIATLVGLLALGVRVALMVTFDFYEVSARPWLLALPPLLAIDLLTLLQLRRGRAAPWWSVAVAAAGGTAVLGLPLLAALFRYPAVTAATVPPMLLMSLLAALFGAWSGSRLGDGVAAAGAASAERAAADARHAAPPWLAPAALVTVLTVVALFILSATPPA